MIAPEIVHAAVGASTVALVAFGLRIIVKLAAENRRLRTQILQTQVEREALRLEMLRTRRRVMFDANLEADTAITRAMESSKAGNA
jgi:hypothetical protein